MTDLDELFAPNRGAWPGAFPVQCLEAVVSRVGPDGVRVVIPSYDRNLEWGPCLPVDARAVPGDRVAILISSARRPWLVDAVPVRLELDALERRIAALEAQHPHV
jgi:hypothetical protein